ALFNESDCLEKEKDIYDIPKDCNLHRWIRINNSVITIPTNPKKTAPVIIGNVKSRTVLLNSYDGIVKDIIAVRAITIIIIFEINPALTTASPIIKPPTIPIVSPIGEGSRIPDSRINSIVIAINRTSKKGWKGILSMDPFTSVITSYGIISKWNETTAIYNAGNN